MLFSTLGCVGVFSLFMRHLIARDISYSQSLLGIEPRVACSFTFAFKAIVPTPKIDPATESKCK